MGVTARHTDSHGITTWLEYRDNNRQLRLVWWETPIPARIRIWNSGTLAYDQVKQPNPGAPASESTPGGITLVQYVNAEGVTVLRLPDSVDYAIQSMA